MQIIYSDFVHTLKANGVQCNYIVTSWTKTVKNIFQNYYCLI